MFWNVFCEHCTAAFATQLTLAALPAISPPQFARLPRFWPTLLCAWNVHAKGPRSIRSRFWIGPSMSSSEYGSAASRNTSTLSRFLLRPLSSYSSTHSCVVLAAVSYSALTQSAPLSYRSLKYSRPPSTYIRIPSAPGTSSKPESRKVKGSTRVSGSRLPDVST